MTAVRSPLDRTMRLVGDLDDDFYNDEYQRDVWNEASAVGMQAYQWCALVAAAILPWVAGAVGAWVALGLLVVWIVTSTLVQLYARERGVNMQLLVRYTQPRVIVGGVVYLIGAFGVIAQLLWGPQVFQYHMSEVLGAVVGAAIGGGGAVLATVHWRRRARQREADEEAREAGAWGAEGH